ncbi:hypothetical protein [Methylacidimicrobium tartarophylax]|uniref:Uncharacterized protein n=1 Tax=Methylacidimicrobium tartarophylax TaxID=1041768 RepID=A0A5E6MLD1_9BACT|nr:hypothetical protein [Methylacidimicrobium tartarophylax]VVM06234.1 hypothetical protein MAMT_01070 [Methylacidimicrobium tartarophylax]
MTKARKHLDDRRRNIAQQSWLMLFVALCSPSGYGLGNLLFPLSDSPFNPAVHLPPWMSDIRPATPSPGDLSPRRTYVERIQDLEEIAT